MYEPKPLFAERIAKLLPDREDREKFWEIVRKEPISSIRCNTLKISPEKLKEKLGKKGWKIEQPYENKEIMIIKSELLPGELGKAKEHLLGYYYVQEISSMLSILALNPKPGELILDLCASPGSKTTQASAVMENKGTIIANDRDMGRIAILSANLERCGCANVIVSRMDGVQLCERLKGKIEFDKILVDAPCSGEGNIRSNPKTLLMWNPKMIKVLSGIQKKLALSAFQLLKKGGEMIYSTCTHAPEENESVISFLLANFPAEIEKINLPIKTREGIIEWEDKKYNNKVKFTARIYPQDNNTEGFFLGKIRKK